jgi:hypothetical protein
LFFAVEQLSAFQTKLVSGLYNACVHGLVKGQKHQNFHCLYAKGHLGLLGWLILPNFGILSLTVHLEFSTHESEAIPSTNQHIYIHVMPNTQ